MCHLLTPHSPAHGHVRTLCESFFRPGIWTDGVLAPTFEFEFFVALTSEPCRNYYPCMQIVFSCIEL